MNDQRKIGFIGAGVMAKTIIKGISGIISKENIMASEISEELALKAANETEVKVITNNSELVKNSDVIILCVKPHAIEKLLKELTGVITKDKLVVSIAAGVSTKSIENNVEKETPVIRVMPNTPALVKEGMSVICRGKHATDADAAYVMELLSSIGRCIEVEEKHINAVTGISGSGPAFMYLIIEALADGGVKMGLKKDIAVKLAAQTALGAAKMVLDTGKHPAVLKDEVATPGGCTVAGLAVMENNNVRSASIKTVQETTKSAAGLG